MPNLIWSQHDPEIACMSSLLLRMSGLDTRTHTQNDYSNPRCACALRVKNIHFTSTICHRSCWMSKHMLCTWFFMYRNMHGIEHKTYKYLLERESSEVLRGSKSPTIILCRTQSNTPAFVAESISARQPNPGCILAISVRTYVDNPVFVLKCTIFTKSFPVSLNWCGNALFMVPFTTTTTTLHHFSSIVYWTTKTLGVHARGLR